MRFYQCKHCKNIVFLLRKSDNLICCCDAPMKPIQPCLDNAVADEHVPVYTIRHDVVRVKIGRVPHPMTHEHRIEWVLIQTVRGHQFKPLFPGEDPQLNFSVLDMDDVVSVFAYCNVHGLWQVGIPDIWKALRASPSQAQQKKKKLRKEDRL